MFSPGARLSCSTATAQPQPRSLALLGDSRTLPAPRCASLEQLCRTPRKSSEDGKGGDESTIRWKLTARGTFSQQPALTELEPSATLSTAELHSGTQDHWACSPAALFIVSSGAARQKAKQPPVSKSKSLKIPPENQEHTPQTGARDHCRH